MTGTERAALRLALGILRRSCYPVRRGDDGSPNQEAPAHDALGVVSSLMWDAKMPDDAGYILDVRPSEGWRPGRARLALHYRRLLREAR